MPTQTFSRQQVPQTALAHPKSSSRHSVFLSLALLSGHTQSKANARTPGIVSDTKPVALKTQPPLAEGEALGEPLEEGDDGEL